MLVLENILLALGSLRANKMRALLTILGIIIGIASVIAIMSVGNSIRSSVTSSMESMGANHITVGLRQKEPEEEVTEEGYRFEEEMQQASMTEEDYLTNEMLEDAEKEFADKIDGVLLSENVGEGQAKDGKLSTNVTLMGVNTAFLKNQDLKLLSGRLLTERDQKEKKGVVVVSDRVVRKLFDGDTKKAAGSQTEVYLNGKYYNYTIVGVYEYDKSAFTSLPEEYISTEMYLPFETAREQAHSTAGYSQITLSAKTGVDSSDFAKELENWFNRKYFRHNEGNADDDFGGYLGDCGHLPAGGRHRHYEYHAGVHHGTDPGDRHQKGPGRSQWLHPPSVYHGSHCHLSAGRIYRNCAGPGSGCGHHEDDGLRRVPVCGRHHFLGGVFDFYRCVFRLLSGQ